MTANMSQSFRARHGSMSAGNAAVALTVTAALTLAALLPDSWQSLLGYRRGAVLEGWQVWRPVTAQALHLGLGHLLPNLAAWGLLCLLLLPRMPAGALTWVLTGSVVGTAVGLVLTPGLAWYVGFSGALHGLLAGGAVWLWRPGRRRLAAALLLGLVLKLVWDVFTGGDGRGLPPGARVVFEAHAWGSLGGVLTGALIRWFTRPPPCV